VRRLEAGQAGRAVARRALFRFTQLFGEQAQERLLGRAAGVLPDGPVSPGDGWTRDTEVDLPMVGRMQRRMKYTLASIGSVDGERVARIESAGEVGMGPANAPRTVELPAGELDVELERSALRDEVLFSVRRGEIIRHTQEGEMDLVTRAPGARGRAGADAPVLRQHLTQRYEMERVE
jgi:hypothetical protein